MRKYSPKAQAEKKSTVSSYSYYAQFYGHEAKYLQQVLDSFKEHHPNRPNIYFVGDSSLDNKYWLHEYAEAVNGYEKILGGKMKEDVCYHVSRQCQLLGMEYGVINCAVEASSLANRTTSWLAELWEQDAFVRDNITENDILVVSIGGNDIALEPSLSTVCHMLAFQVCNSEEEIEKDLQSAWGSSHFIHMFKEQTVEYINQLICKRKPKRIVVSMIYFPDEKDVGSWADLALSTMGYNSNPRKLQVSIEQVYKHATCQIAIDGTIVIPFPLFRVLDGKCSKDYVQRVEPSSQGGEKIAQALLALLS